MEIFSESLECDFFHDENGIGGFLEQAQNCLFLGILHAHLSN